MSTTIIITIIAILILSGQWPKLLNDLFDRYEMGEDELVPCDMLLFCFFFYGRRSFLLIKRMKLPRTVSVKYMHEGTPTVRELMQLFCT